MMCLRIVFALSALLVVSAQSNWNITEESDFEVGFLNPNDTLLFKLVHEREPEIGLPDIFVGAGSDFINITYVSAIEAGDYPDARSSLASGGPGYNFATVKLSTGPTLGFNYTISIYGYNLEVPEGAQPSLEFNLFP